MPKVDAEIFHIVPMGKKHMEEVLGIESISFPTPWNQRLFQNELENPNSRIFLLEINQGEKLTIAGHLCLWLVKDEVHILNLAVHPLYRRKGLALLLLSYALSYSSGKNILKAILEVRERNYPARCLYEKVGFHRIGVRSKYYQDTGEDALIMERDL